MTEQQYQNKIIKKYEKNGYTVIKLIKTNITGIPDLVILKENENPIFIECKKPKGGVVSAIQEYRLLQLKTRGFDVYLSWGDEIEKY